MTKQPTLNLSTVLLIGIIVLVGLAGWFGFNASRNHGSQAAGATSKYQAVFLTNGQVYFGRLGNKAGQFLTLNEVFYLQTNSSLQAGADASASDLTLIKLGKELHGPTDEMVINRDQVLFFEGLKEDSKVVKAINDYKAGQAK